MSLHALPGIGAGHDGALECVVVFFALGHVAAASVSVHEFQIVDVDLVSTYTYDGASTSQVRTVLMVEAMIFF